MKLSIGKLVMAIVASNLCWWAVVHADNESQIEHVIENGLENQFNYMSIPRGEIEIMSALSSEMEKSDWSRKRFKNSYLDNLKGAAERGFLSYKEHTQSSLESIGRMGAKTFTVTPSDKALQAKDEERSNDDWVKIKFAECEVTKIVKNVEYSHPTLPQSDEFRLVVGSYKRIPTAVAKDYEELETKEFKFRALVKVNQFTGEYHFRTADWGLIDEGEWKTNRIR